MELLATSCCREKRSDPRLLPAVDRYRSPRIAGLVLRARRLGTPMVILSGKFGLLDPESPIPWYDHALAEAEVAALAPRVAAQLAEREATRLVFFGSRLPGWEPYFRVLRVASAAAGVELETREAVSELVGREPELAGRLFALVARDEDTRARLAADGSLFAGYADPMREVHEQNADAVAAILDRSGWPGRSRVGEEGARSAWLVAQHAISLPGFQLRCLDLIERAAGAGEADPTHHARLLDRIRFNQRRPQVYGSVFDWDAENRLSPWSIENEEGVDERRAAVGLPPLHEVAERLRRGAAAAGEGPPASYEERQHEIREWSRGAGWLD